MEYEVSGTVRCDRVSSSRGVRSYVRKQIKKWLQNQRAPGEIPRALFDVKFAREGAGHVVACSLRLRVGNRTWTAYACTEGLQRAFMMTLNQLRPQLAAMRAASLPP